MIYLILFILYFVMLFMPYYYSCNSESAFLMLTLGYQFQLLDILILIFCFGILVSVSLFLSVPPSHFILSIIGSRVYWTLRFVNQLFICFGINIKDYCYGFTLCTFIAERSTYPTSLFLPGIFAVWTYKGFATRIANSVAPIYYFYRFSVVLSLVSLSSPPSPLSQSRVRTTLVVNGHICT